MIIQHLMQQYSETEVGKGRLPDRFKPQTLHEFPEKVKIHILFLNSMLLFQAGMINLYAILAIQSQCKNLKLKMYCN